MGRRGKRYKINKKKFIPRVSLVIIIIIGIIIIAQKSINSSKNNVDIANNKEMQEQNNEKNEIKLQEEIIKEESKEEQKEEAKEVKEEQNKTKKIDYLANLNVPVYKKSEKNIKIPILIYHEFQTPIPEEDVYNLFSNQERFEENVTTLLDEGYTFITLEDLYKYSKGEIGLPEKVVIITMDDGWEGNYLEAFPILKKYNIPATIFVVNTLLGTQGYFTWEQAKEMYDSGLVKIHCHGYRHIAYSNQSKETVVADYTKSHKEIEEHLGEKVQKIMAYPAGRSNADTIQWLKEIGFEVQVQTKYGTVNKSEKLDLTDLGRIRSERASGSRILAVIKSGGINN